MCQLIGPIDTKPLHEQTLTYNQWGPMDSFGDHSTGNAQDSDNKTCLESAYVIRALYRWDNWLSVWWSIFA